MVEAHEVQDRGVQVGDVARFIDGREAEFIRRADGLATAHAGSGEPHREAVPVVIAAGFVDSLAGRSATGGTLWVRRPRRAAFRPTGRVA